MSAQDESKGALRAIRRAATSARKRAARYEVPLAIWRDGEIAFLSPEQTEAQQDGADQPATAVESKAE